MLKGTGGPWSPEFESSASHAVKRHANILSRLTEVLGPLPADLGRLLARRISFPWYLYEMLHEQGRIWWKQFCCDRFACRSGGGAVD